MILVKPLLDSETSSSGIIFLVSSCNFLKPWEPGIGQQVDWSSIAGWTEDSHADAWPALLRNCIALGSKTEWHSICAAAEQISDPTDLTARSFFEQWFVARELLGKGGKPDGGPRNTLQKTPAW